jgi:hypothetical protein
LLTPNLSNSPETVSHTNFIPEPHGRNGGSVNAGTNRRRGVRGQRLIGIFLLGLILFNFPILALFNVGTTVFGIPVLFAYLFLAWAALILLMYLVIERLS